MSRRPELALVAILLCGSIAAVLFVFSQLTGPGGSFAAEERTKEAPAPPPAVDADPPAPDPRPVAPPAAEEPPPAPTPPPVDPIAAPDPEPEIDPNEFAQLTLELLTPPGEKEREVRVTVKDQAGDPVPGALVVFREGTEILYRERADDLGVAFFLPYSEERGPFRIDGLAHGFVPATAPSVAAGAETDLILEARPFVEGEVRAPSRGRGIVRLFSGNVERTQALGPDGTFRFEELDEGDVLVQAEVEPYGAAAQSFFLEAGTSRFVRLKIKPDSRARIGGHIGYWPGGGKAWINGVAVAVETSGAYKFDRAILGVNEIVVDAPGKALLRERFTVKGLTRHQFNFRLYKEGSVRGRVRDARTNRPVANAEIRIGFDLGNPRNERVPRFPIDKVPVVHSDRDGRFEIARLDKRLVYLVSVVAPGYGQFLGEALPSASSHLTANLPPGPFVSGRLRGVGGVPRFAVVTARPLKGETDHRRFNVEGWDHGRAVRDGRGEYHLHGLLPGAYLLRVDSKDFGSVETIVDLGGGRRTQLDFRLSPRDHAAEDEAELLARLPAVIEELGDEPAPADTTILRIDTRRPIDEEPFPGVKVLFFEEEREFAPPMDFDELEIDLLGLPEANYRAVLTHPRLKKPLVRDDIVLRRGKPFTIQFR